MVRTTPGNDLHLTVPVYQADVMVSEADPTSGLEYALLGEIVDPMMYIRILGIAAEVVWTVQPTPLEIHVYADGEQITFYRANPNTAQYYTGEWYFETHDGLQNLVTGNVIGSQRGFLLEARSVYITMETTGGTVSRLRGRVFYQLFTQ